MVPLIVQIQPEAESKELEDYTCSVQPSGGQSRAGKLGEWLGEVNWRITCRGAQERLSFLKRNLLGKKESIKSLEILFRSYLNSNSL